ncbi:MAG: STAS domain-containing protein [Tepidisphaeraceae bacterium]|jgi:anti-sigma B factor antagonist
MSDHEPEVRLVGSSRKEGDAVVAAVAGEVDLHNSPQLRKELMELIARHKPKRMVLNLAQVPYMDSSAIAVLVEVLRKVGKGGKVVLTTLQPRVRGILEIAKLNEVFKIAADEKEGMVL